MNKTIDWLIARLGENSTWRGLIGLATSAGVVLQPEQGEKIIALGIALVAVINIFRQAPPTAQAVALALNTGNTEILKPTPNPNDNSK